jgi:transcriptional regulator with XRE-family HTH domain
MTAVELRDALDRLGLTQTDAAHLLGVVDRAVRHWTSGTRPVPEMAGRFLLLLDALDITPAEAMAAMSVEKRAQSASGSSRIHARKKPQMKAET